AGHGDQRPGHAGRARAARRQGPGDERAQDQRRVRGLHPPPRHPPPREGPDRDLRRRHRQSVLHHRLGRRAARDRDRRRPAAQGDQGRRRLRQGPEEVPRRGPLRQPELRRGHRPRPAGDGHRRLRPVPRQRAAAADLRHVATGRAAAHPARRTDRHPRARAGLSGPARPAAPTAAGRRPASAPPPAPSGGAGSAYNPAVQPHQAPEPAMLNEIKNDAQTRMAKSVDALRHALQKVRTGRASTALVDHIKVNYYGSDMPLSQVASVAVSDARSLTITPWEKQMVGAVEKALLASDLGLTPNTAGTTIRLNLPALTEERRRDLAKVVHGEGEDAKVAIRNIRRDAIQRVKELQKEKQISEDDERRAEDEIQKITDKAIKDVDEVGKAKEQELMAV